MRRLHADRGENHDPTGTAYYRQGRSTRSLTHHKRTVPLELGESDNWVAGKLHDVDHPAAAKATALLRQGQRRRAYILLESALRMLAGAPNGNELSWFSKASL